MKSDPVRSAAKTSVLEGVPTSASGDMGGGTERRSSAGCAATVAGTAAKAAAPAAALFRKFRRSTSVFFGLITAFHLRPCLNYTLYHTVKASRHRRAALLLRNTVL